MNLRVVHWLTCELKLVKTFLMALQERLRSMDLGYLLGYLIPGEMKCFLMKHRYE